MIKMKKIKYKEKLEYYIKNNTLIMDNMVIGYAKWQKYLVDYKHKRYKILDRFSNNINLKKLKIKSNNIYLSRKNLKNIFVRFLQK